MADALTVAAVDDHPLFLAGLKRAIGRSDEFKLVGEGASAEDAIRLSQSLTPGILLLDIGIPGGGIEAARAIAALAPGVRIVMLTASEDDEDVAVSLAAGAKGYLVKGSPTREVIQALRAVREGQTYVTPEVASRVLANKMRAKGEPSASGGADAQLNDREQQVLDFAAQGLSNKEIAAKLNLTVHTVKNYMSRILSKLRVNNRVRAAAKFQAK
jgi:two-component system, NarL family, nitrate/nitrite response regulator NarL